MQTSSVTTAVIAIVLTAFQLTGIKLSDELRLDVQNGIAEAIVLASIAWTAYQHWRAQQAVNKLSAQVVLKDEVPVAGPDRGKIPNGVMKFKAKEVLRA